MKILGLALLVHVTAPGHHGDIRPLLRSQGFYAPINGQETIKYAGHIAQGRNDYEIYLFNGAFRAADVYHGVNRLIVIMNGSIFVGAYDSSSASDCKVRGQKVICRTDYPPSVIDFTKRGPPYEIVFDGEIDELTFGNKLKAYWCNEHPCPRLKSALNRK
jgi:hypothetical protein